jgi:predicted MPP superfamily phosphohydrolase
MNKAKEFRSILFVGDMHLTEKRPLSRTDHWMQAQKNKLDFIKKTAEKNNSIIVSVGDVFDTTRNSNYFLAWCIVHMPKMLVVPGNHDLPGNAMENYQKSPLNVLEQAGVITVLDAPTYLMDCVKIYPMPWGIAPEMPSDLDTTDTNIAVMHYPLYENEVPFWHKDMAMSFLERFNQTINVSLNFEETLERYLAANNVEEPIRNIVQGILEKEELV